MAAKYKRYGLPYLNKEDAERRATELAQEKPTLEFRVGSDAFGRWFIEAKTKPRRPHERRES